MPTILLIRHAQASFGSADYDVLSQRGRQQTAALAAGLERRGIRAHRVISGSLRRQLDTARPCARPLGVAVEVDERFDEYTDRDILIHHSDVSAGLERRPGDAPLGSREFQEILNRALGQWIAAGASGPAAETWAQFQARVKAGLEDVARGLERGQTALVVSSGGVIATLSAQLMSLPPQALIAFNHVSINTGITKLTVGRSGISLISANEHAHLEEAGAELITYR